MLKTVAVALLAIGIFVSFAQAKRTKHVMHKHHAKLPERVIKNAIPMCAEGQQANATCACGTDASGRPFTCQTGQWCRTLAHACNQ